jgi:hypothetical protein
MHDKITVADLELNFLPQVLWPKTSLGNQQTHLWLLWILLYIFMIEIKHKLGNNISNRYRIRIKSPEMHFNITRQYPRVGLKNNYIFIYKNHLGRFINNTR